MIITAIRRLTQKTQYTHHEEIVMKILTVLKKNTYTDRTVFSHTTTRKSWIIYDITYTICF